MYIINKIIWTPNLLKYAYLSKSFCYSNDQKRTHIFNDAKNVSGFSFFKRVYAVMESQYWFRFQCPIDSYLLLFEEYDFFLAQYIPSEK